MRGIVPTFLCLASCATPQSAASSRTLADLVVAHVRPPPQACTLLGEDERAASDSEDAVTALRREAVRRGGNYVELAVPVWQVAAVQWLKLELSGSLRVQGHPRGSTAATFELRRAGRIYACPSGLPTLAEEGRTRLASAPPISCAGAGELTARDPTGSYVPAVESLRKQGEERGANYVAAEELRRDGGALTVTARLYVCSVAP